MQKIREHEVHTRTLHYELEPGEVPDLPVMHTRTKTIRPDHLVVHLRWDRREHRWELDYFGVGGRRVLKHRLSDHRESSRYDLNRAPEELQALVRHVLEQVV